MRTLLAGRARRQIALDAFTALAVGALSLWELLSGDGFRGPTWFNAGVIVVATAGLTLRRIQPVVCAGLVATALIVQAGVAGTPESAGEFVATLLAAFSVAAHTDGRQLRIGAGALVVAGVVVLLRDPLVTSFAAALPSIFIVTSAWVAGRFVRSRDIRAMELLREKVDLERARELEGEAAAEAERARIARELHDIVAHGLSAIVLQAGAARLDTSATPAELRRKLEVIEDTARQSGGELRRLLGIVRSADSPAGTEPQPGLDQLQDLLARSRASGLDVTLATEGSPRPVSPGVSLSAYRIVQEALTNVMKHSAAKTCTVLVRYGKDAVGLEVTDDGPGDRHPAADGFGLRGIRERVAIYGGSLQYDTRPDGSFALRVSMPTDPGAA